MASLVQGLGDLQGRERFRAEQDLEGFSSDPVVIAGRILAEYNWECTGWENAFNNGVQWVFNDHKTLLDAALADLVVKRDECVANRNPQTEQALRDAIAIVRQHLNTFQEARDASAELFANTLTTAATVGIVIFSGGTATPLMLAAWGAAAQTMGHFAIAGNTYDLEAMPADIVTGALAGLTANVSFFGTGEAGNMLSYVMRGAAQGAIDGAATGFMTGAVDSAMHSSTWQQGWQVGLLQVAQDGAISALIGGLTGGTIGTVHRLLYCFPAGTPVSTADGLKPIETLTSHDRVWTWNFRSGAWELQPVLHRFEHVYHGDMVTLTIASETLESTGNHPFWVLEGQALSSRPRPEHIPADEPGNRSLPGRWVDARDLRIGDLVVRKDAAPARIEAKTSRMETRTVYNLHVAENQNFLVGENQVLVHNRRQPMPVENNGGTWIDPITGVNTRNGQNGTWTVQDPQLRNILAPNAQPGTLVQVVYRNGFPDFAPHVRSIGGIRAEVDISLNIEANLNRRYWDNISADQAFVNLGGINPQTGLAWTRAEFTAYRELNGLTWHHHETVNFANNYSCRMQLVPTRLNSLSHLGGRGILDDWLKERGLL